LKPIFNWVFQVLTSKPFKALLIKNLSEKLLFLLISEKVFTFVFYGIYMSKGSGSLHLPVLVELDEDGVFIVSCPTFKGCHSYGKTIDEAMNNLKEVVEMCMEEESTISFNRFVGFREMEFFTKVA